MRVTAQLIDAVTGNHLWAERYDRPVKDFFAVQDEIVQKIVLALDVKLLEGEQSRLRRQATNSVEAYELFRRADELWAKVMPEANAEARRLAERAVALDPKFGIAWALLAWIEFRPIDGGSGKPTKAILQRFEDLARKAVAADESEGMAQMTMAQVYLLKGEFEKAIEAGKRECRCTE